MRLLKFNGELVDIDDSTAIGIDFQAYNVSEPGSRKIAASNKFTIPRTANNMRIIGFAGNPQSSPTSVYSTMSCEYWNDNVCLIRSGKARVTEVADRITVFAFEKPNVFAQMQDVPWPTFQNNFITWLQAEKSLPSAASPFTGTFTDFLSPYLASSEGVILPFLIGNLALYDPAEGSAYIEDLGSLYLKYQTTVSGEPVRGAGGHFCVYCKIIFEYIEDTYGVDFSVLTGGSYNIFDDAVAKVMYTPLRNLSIEHTLTGFYFRYDNTGKFLPEDTTDDKAEKTLFDFTKAFFQMFNCLIDRVPSLDGTEKYIIRRMDDIIHAPVVDLSGKISGTPVFSPTLENYNQNNYIKFAGVYEGGNELTGSKKIVCRNLNLDIGSTSDSLFDIEAFIPAGIVAGGDTVLNMSASDSFSLFAFFVSSGNASTTVKSMQEGTEVTAPLILQIAQLYDLNNEYTTLESMVEYPVFYKLKRWLTLGEVNNLVFFARYYIRELNGYFFLNKISGYNPQKSTEPTQLELIKIPT